MVVGAAERPDRSLEAAFSDYVLPEVELLLRVALSMTRNAADAEDLVQDTLLRAFRSIGTFDGRHPRAWLLTILRNAQINRVRRKRPELLRDPEAGARRAESQAPHESAESEVLARAFDSRVEEAFARLPDRFKQVIELVDLQGLSYQVAADVLGVPVGTVMSRLHRARKRIRSQLEVAGLTSRRPT